MKKKLRIIFVWTLVSLLLQFGAYSLLNNKVAQVMGPVGESNVPITRHLKATIPGSNLKDFQISYAKDYLAYTENGALKVFNLEQKKVVFEKKMPSTNDNTLGVLKYQWLPDRDTLLYFYAKKNPNSVTYVTVPTKSQVTNKTKLNTEDTNQNADKDVSKVAESRIETRYGNPRIVELYSLELPNSDEDIAPDDRFNQTIEEFPEGGKIEELVFSTSTNLIYLTAKNESSERLMEIDVMKNVRTLSRSGETINEMAASDRYGTLYIDSKIWSSNQQVIAFSGGKRRIISKNSKDTILGIRDGKVYIGEVQNNKLVKIKTTSDLDELKDNPSLKTEWEGSIPYKNVRKLIGAKGQIVINDQTIAYIISYGQLKEIELYGDENHISDDGAELIQLTKDGISTLVELKPL